MSQKVSEILKEQIEILSEQNKKHADRANVESPAIMQRNAEVICRLAETLVLVKGRDV